MGGKLCRVIALWGALLFYFKMQESEQGFVKATDDQILSDWASKSCSSGGVSCVGDRVVTLNIQNPSIGGSLPASFTNLDQLQALYEKTRWHRFFFCL